MLLAFVSGCSPPDQTAADPSVDDLLVGRVANAERLTAIEAVTTALGDHLGSTEPATTAGLQVMTTCNRGQNDWKVHDGYRLRCRAISNRVIAWRGDFGPGHDSIREALARHFTGPDFEANNLPPHTAALLHDEGAFRSADDTTVYLMWGKATGLTADNSNLDLASRFNETVSVITPLTADSIVAATSGYRWFALLTATRTYYQDHT